MSNKVQPRDSGTPVGLDNTGNTCFMNSLLQCYFALPPLVKLILQSKPKLPNPHSEFLKSVQLLFTELIGSIKKSVNPKPVFDSLSKASKSPISFGNQEDVGEFHMYFVETLKKALKICEPVESSSSLKELFIGVHLELIHLSAEEIKEQNVKFGPLIIGNDEGDLVSAWENSGFCSIPEYRRETGSVMSVNQEQWIKDLPQIFFFQIKRAFYAEGIEEGYKDCSGLKIPNVLYPDRMMIENRETVLKIRKEIKVLLDKKKDLTGKLQNFLSFATKNSLEQSLKTVIEFLGTSFWQEFDAKYEQGIEYLKGIQTATMSQKSQLEEEITKIEEEINTKYSELNKNPYSLHSILVHQGVAGFGHYFALIKDHTEKLWRKYNDQLVTVVCEEEVMKIVHGESLNQSAYCVLYINEQLILKSDTGLPFITYQTNALSQGTLSNEYFCYIENNELINYVDNENMNFLKQFENPFMASSIKCKTGDLKDSSSCADIVCRNYNRKIIQEAEITRKMANERFKNVQSFSRFLCYSRDTLLCKYAIMDFVCKSSTGVLVEGLSDDDRIVVLQHIGGNMSGSQKAEYSRKMKSYSQLLKYVKLGLYVLTLVLANKIESATRVFVFRFLSEQMIHEDLYGVLRQMFLYIIFALISELLKACEEKNIDKVTERCNCLHFLYSYFKDFGALKGWESLIDAIEKKFKGKFKDEAGRLFKTGINIAKLKELDSSLDIDKIFEDTSQFNEEFANIDMYTFEDNGQMNLHYENFTGELKKITERWRKIVERNPKQKDLSIKDFE